MSEPSKPPSIQVTFQYTPSETAAALEAVFRMLLVLYAAEYENPERKRSPMQPRDAISEAVRAVSSQLPADSPFRDFIKLTGERLIADST